jgi:hypothetical protein
MAGRISKIRRAATGKLMADQNRQKRVEVQLPSYQNPERREDSIFGPRGIMHHINVGQKTRRSYLLEETFERQDFKIHGHNGFTIGDCWPLQIAALRDGVHGKFSSTHPQSLAHSDTWTRKQSRWDLRVARNWCL